MKYRKLGKSDLEVSLICLGTMTYGEQNTQEEAFEQLDYSLAQGVNFIDTAEMYSVPNKANTCGSTETIIGRWFQERKNRDKIIVATKVAGPKLPYIRSGSSLTKKQIFEAVEGSLKRLSTDYIDLYQLHWPTRHTNFFSQLGFTPKQDEAKEPTILESLEAMSELVKQGKVRYIGVSNETPWGVYQFLSLAEKHGLEKIISVQNPYNLLNRTYEVGLSEFSYRDNVDLLAYSPLAFGVLSGKYLNNQKPPKARLILYPDFSRYTKLTSAVTMTEKYYNLAKESGLDPSQMALAFVNSRFFMGGNIIGATTMEQLKINIASIDLELSEEILQKIEELHADNSNPAP
jgi:aryl-alcohol dehydrogenase-like predicted oxidoreductase